MSISDRLAAATVAASSNQNDGRHDADTHEHGHRGRQPRIGTFGHH